MNNYVENVNSSILSALENMANLSIDIKQLLQTILGESTRVANLYSRYIGTEKEKSNYKEIYDKAMVIGDACEFLQSKLFILKDPIQDLLNEVGKELE